MSPVASQIRGKYLCFLVTQAKEKRHVDPKNLVLFLTRFRDFLVERVNEFRWHAGGRHTKMYVVCDMCFMLCYVL